MRGLNTKIQEEKNENEKPHLLVQTLAKNYELIF